MAFRTGVRELKRAVGILDQMCGSFCGVTNLDGYGSNNKSSEMEVNGEKMMSLDELSRYLDETRCVCCVYRALLYIDTDILQLLSIKLTKPFVFAV